MKLYNNPWLNFILTKASGKKKCDKETRLYFLQPQLDHKMALLGLPEVCREATAAGRPSPSENGHGDLHLQSEWHTGDSGSHTWQRGETGV